MEAQHFLGEAVVILVASVLVVLASHRLRLAPVVGLLITGLVIGPTGLKLVADIEGVKLFAEIGLVFFLFTVGLEFSLDRLRELRRPFLLGGPLQTGLCLLAAALVAVALGLRLPQAIFLGFLATQSCTAIVLKLYADRGELESPQGRILLGILLFQDFLLVPIVILTPMLGGGGDEPTSAAILQLVVALGVAVLAFLLARRLLPRLLYQLVRTQSREVFILGALGVCLGMALLTASLGFSLVLGAFLAGIIVSESEYSAQVVSEVGPFRDAFSSIFFISIGMLVDLGFAARHLPAILAVAAAILVVKAPATALAVGALRVPSRVVVLVGLSLAQMGEFSFVLLEMGRERGLLDNDLYQLALGASVLSLLVTPFAIALAPVISERLRLAAPPAEDPASGEKAKLQDHVIIVGYGTAGRMLSRVLREARIPYLVVELDGELVRRASRQGESILFGDAARLEILTHAGVAEASMIVLVASDRAGVRRSIQIARQLNPSLFILARTRRQNEVDELRRLGANEVIADELEASIEIFTHALEQYHVPRNLIRTQTRLLRGESYRMMRAPSMSGAVSEALLDLLAHGTTDLYRLGTGSPLVGRTLRNLQLRKRTGATVIAIVRGETSHTNPSADLPLEGGDCLVVVGSHAQVEQAFETLEDLEVVAAQPPATSALPATAN